MLLKGIKPAKDRRELDHQAGPRGRQNSLHNLALMVLWVRVRLRFWSDSDLCAMSPVGFQCLFLCWKKRRLSFMLVM